MDHLLDAVDQAVAQRNWYAALMLALTLPDICAKVDGRAGGSAKRYASWAKDWLEPTFAVEVARPITDEHKSLQNPDMSSASAGTDRADVILKFLASRKDEKPYVKQFLKGDDLYALRCAFSHQGSYDISEERVRQALSRFHITTPDAEAHMNLVTYDGKMMLQLRADLFCIQICEAVKLWLRDRSGDVEVANRLAMLSRLGSARVF